MTSKQPWLAVFLSFIWAGAGQFYAGKRTRGICLLVASIILYLLGAGSYFSFLSSEDAAQSRLAGLLFIAASVGFIIVCVYALFDAHKIARRFNADHQLTPEPFLRKNPWLAVFLSAFITGLGQLYSRQWLKGLLFIIASFILGTAGGSYYLILFLLIPLSFLSLQDAFDSAEKMNLSGRKFVDQGSRGAKFIVIAMLIYGGIPLSGIVKAHFVQAYKLPSGSMLPTLKLGDHIYANREIRGKGPVAKGDVIVFIYPKTDPRILSSGSSAWEEDKVEIKNKKVFINDAPYPDPAAIFTDKTIFPASMMPRDNFGPVASPRENCSFWGTTGT